MMDRIILDQIPFTEDKRGLMDFLRIRPGTGNSTRFSTLFKEALEIAAPKAIYAVAEARLLDGDAVEIGGVQFQSPLLCVNLDTEGTVFPFAAACGVELEEWSGKLPGRLHSFRADSI